MSSAKSILITGASSGIGAALAEAYAGTGVHLTINGRDRTRLDAVANACRRLGATVEPALVDVTDRAAMAAWVDCTAAVAWTDVAVAACAVPCS